MPNLVRGEGPLDARIVLIGEAPGATENALRRPFMGASGNLLMQWWRDLGLQRGQVRIDNLLQRMPPGGKIENATVEDVTEGIHDLRARLALLQPSVIVPTGNYATFALTGKGKVKAAVRKALGEEVTASEAEKKAGITSLRGSVYSYETLAGWNCKLIPTIHPAWYLRGQKHKQEIAYADWRRIIKESASPVYSAPKPVHVIEPTEHDVAQYVKFVKYHEKDLKLALDIETWGRTLSCVGFSHSPDYSITIRTDSRNALDRFLPYIMELCGTACPKILQNGLYDFYWLAAKGIKPVNWKWDTMAMAHAINPIGQFSLEYLCSLRLPYYQYWKDEAKDAEEIKKYARDLQSLWTYNGLDCCNTHELQAHLEQELRDSGRLEFYFRHYRDLFAPLLALMRHGVAVDTEAQKKWAKELMLGCSAIREELTALAGEDLFAQKDFSGMKLRKFFHEKLGIPKKTKVTKGVEGKKRTVTLDKHALNDFIQKAQLPRHKKKYEPAKAPALLILNFRRNKKKADLMKGAWDKDGRIHCSYKFTTESGRLASSKNPMRKGYNLQNVSRKVRNTFVPDKSSVFIKVDLSQIEDRVVKMLTGSDRLVKLANLRPAEFDAHTYNASRIFKISTADVSKDQRYLGKKAVHGAQRGMTGDKLSNELLADEDAPLVVSPGECQKMIDAYLEDHHEIRDTYFPGIRKEMWDNKCLTNSWGRVWNIGEFAEFDDDLYRRGYSFKPQSENADLLNQWGLLEAFTFIKINKLKTRINLQVHDEIICSCPPEEAYDVASFVVRSLEQPRYYLGNPLVVPAEVTVARNWKDSEFEFKSMPDRRKFEKVVYHVYQDIRRNFEGEAGRDDGNGGTEEGKRYYQIAQQ